MFGLCVLLMVCSVSDFEKKYPIESLAAFYMPFLTLDPTWGAKFKMLQVFYNVPRYRK